MDDGRVKRREDLNIALDYDGTYTQDPELWDMFIKKAFDRGHVVYCITMRYESEQSDILEGLNKLVNIIYTGRRAKRDFTEKRGIKIDIWIDDNPVWIYKSSI